MKLILISFTILNIFILINLKNELKTFIYFVDHVFIMIIPATVVPTITNYILAIAAAVIMGLILRLPLLPERPMRQSWTISVIFPTAVLALGFTAMVFKLGYQGMVVALIIGVLSALFSKYILEKVLPKPSGEEST